MKKESKTKKVDPETLKRIRKAVSEGKIEFASSLGVDDYKPEVNEILEKVSKYFNRDFTGAWVSDLSCLSDFIYDIKIDYEKLSEILGIPVQKENTNILELAKTIRKLKVIN